MSEHTENSDEMTTAVIINGHLVMTSTCSVDLRAVTSLELIEYQKTRRYGDFPDRILMVTDSDRQLLIEYPNREMAVRGYQALQQAWIPARKDAWAVASRKSAR